MRKRSEIAKPEETTDQEKVDEPAGKASPPTDKKAAVEEISGKLRDELDPTFQTRHAQRKAKESPIRGDMDRIVEKVFVNDIDATYEKLIEGLKVGEKRSEYGVIRKALDEAEDNAHLAHRLYVTGKIAREEWEAKNEVVFAAMWSQATASLQKEKDSGTRSKQITDADVRSRCSAENPEEWPHQETKRAKYKATVDSLADLAEKWSSRCHTLRTMLDKMRS